MEMELSEYLSSARRLWWVPVLAALGAVAVSYWRTQSWQPLYQAEAVLVVEDPLLGGRSEPDWESVMKGQLRGLEDRSLHERAAAALGGIATADTVGGAVDGEYVRDTRYLKVKTVMSRPQDAMAVANAVARAMERMDRERYDADVTETGAYFAEAAAKAKAEGVPADAVKELEATAARAPLLVAQKRPRLRVWQESLVPGPPRWPQRVHTVALSGGGGLLVGSALAGLGALAIPAQSRRAPGARRK
ncbi:MAG: hypothetical protein HYV63_25095 [Candidatus Schekmanbacteria bacterium]|nr:hypothetical protein [Candidatus Schekmanbacteria bacterium]